MNELFVYVLYSYTIDAICQQIDNLVIFVIILSKNPFLRNNAQK